VSAAVGAQLDALHAPPEMSPPEIAPGDIPLRERKFARTKVALLAAALRRLSQGRRLESIPVKELCEEVEVSEATFFNYFPRKSDLILYSVQLWTIEAVARTRDLRGLSAIEEIFRMTGEKLEPNLNFMLELIAQQAQNDDPQEFPDVSTAERLAAFPDLPGALDAEVRRSVSQLFRGHLTEAVDDGELPRTTDVEHGILCLATIFFGLPLVLHCGSIEAPVRALWQRQLHTLWAGLRAG
jgi:AcrR family transcriptional regulator